MNRFGEFGEIAKIIAGRLQANQQTHEIAQMAVILAGCSTSFKVLWKAGVSKLKRDAAVERLKDFVSVLASNDALWMAPKFEETRLNIPGIRDLVNTPFNVSLALFSLRTLNPQS